MRIVGIRHLRGALEISVATLLAAVDLALGVPAGLRGDALLLGLAACLGAAVCGRRICVGIGILTSCLAGFIAIAPAPIGAAEHAILIPVASAAAAGRRNLALGVGLVFTSLEALAHTVRHNRGAADLVIYIFLWLIMFGIAALVGVAINLSRVAERLRADAAHAAGQRQIAGNLHKTAAHGLALLALRAEQAARSQQPHQELNEIADAARSISRDLRAVMSLLQSTPIPHEPPRSASLAKEVEKAAAQLTRAGFNVTTLVEGPVDLVPLEVSVGLADVILEATNNVERHGDQSRPVVFLLEATDDRIELLISNGHSGSSKTAWEGFGLVRIKDTMEPLGGDLELVITADLWTLRCTR